MKNIDELSKSVVRVECFNKAGDLYCTGSGVVVFDSDKVITNYHVISGDCYTVTVTSDDGQSASVTQVLGYDEDKDLALLQLETPTSIKPLPIGDSENLQRGDEVIAIGSPLGLLNTASTGIVSGFLEDGDINAIQTSASISSGSSGGALLNKKGELIGITYAGFEGGENLNLAIPAYEINSLEILDYPKLPSGFYNEIYHEIDLTELLATYDTLPKDFKVKTTGYVSTIAKTKEDDAEIAYIVANPSDVLGFTKIDEIEFGERTLSNNQKTKIYDYSLNDNYEELVRCVNGCSLRIIMNSHYNSFIVNKVKVGDKVTLEFYNGSLQVINPETFIKEYQDYKAKYGDEEWQNFGREIQLIRTAAWLSGLRTACMCTIPNCNNPEVISVN